MAAGQAGLEARRDFSGSLRAPGFGSAHVVGAQPAPAYPERLIISWNLRTATIVWLEQFRTEKGNALFPEDNAREISGKPRSFKKSDDPAGLSLAIDRNRPGQPFEVLV
jgi:hypothetical protein